MCIFLLVTAVASIMIPYDSSLSLLVISSCTENEVLATLHLKVTFHREMISLMLALSPHWSKVSRSVGALCAAFDVRASISAT